LHRVPLLFGEFPECHRRFAALEIRQSLEARDSQTPARAILGELASLRVGELR
jgi:hypothetical protein